MVTAVVERNENSLDLSATPFQQQSLVIAGIHFEGIHVHLFHAKSVSLLHSCYQQQAPASAAELHYGAWLIHRLLLIPQSCTRSR